MVLGDLFSNLNPFSLKLKFNDNSLFNKQLSSDKE
jgi:hypothetical protein